MRVEIRARQTLADKRAEDADTVKTSETSQAAPDSWGTTNLDGERSD